MVLLPTLPDTSIRSVTGTSEPQGAFTLTSPPCTATSSVSSTMPGLVIRVSAPLRTSASICSVGQVTTAWVKSRVTTPLRHRTPIRCGTAQRPSRFAEPLRQSMRTISLGLTAATPATDPGTAGRSETRASSSP